MNSQKIGMAIRCYLRETCPACGYAKAFAAPFCDHCLALLTPHLQESVTEPSTYLFAFGPALRMIERVRSNVSTLSETNATH